MDNQENINSKNFEFPQKVEGLSKEECAKILRRAFAASGKYKTQADNAKILWNLMILIWLNHFHQ